MYGGYYRLRGMEHEFQLCLAEQSGQTHGPRRTVQLYSPCAPGPDFSERDGLSR
jgi:hypothetical protein